MFTGFTDETIRFFLDIRFHNSVAYYNENKERYLTHVQQPYYDLITDLAPFMQEIDPEMEIRPYRCLARLRRDTRFTRDKSPYKDHLWLTFRRAAEPREGSLGFWFGFGPDWIEWGLGFQGENQKVMERFRRELAANPARIGGIITNCDLGSKHLIIRTQPARRIVAPENIPSHLRDLYTSKDIYIQQTRPDRNELGSRDLFTHLLTDFRAMAPLYRMLRGIQDELIEEERAELAAQQQKQKLHTDEW